MTYIVVMHRRGSDDPRLKTASTYDKAAVIAHKWFMSFDFTLVDGVPFDHGARDGEVTLTYKMYKGMVVEFVHRDGEGPTCEIRRG